MLIVFSWFYGIYVIVAFNWGYKRTPGLYPDPPFAVDSGLACGILKATWRQADDGCWGNIQRLIECHGESVGVYKCPASER